MNRTLTLTTILVIIMIYTNIFVEIIFTQRQLYHVVICDLLDSKKEIEGLPCNNNKVDLTGVSQRLRVFLPG